jgi:hypothetical protein
MMMMMMMKMMIMSSLAGATTKTKNYHNLMCYYVLSRRLYQNFVVLCRQCSVQCAKHIYHKLEHAESQTVQRHAEQVSQTSASCGKSPTCGQPVRCLFLCCIFTNDRTAPTSHVSLWPTTSTI